MLQNISKFISENQSHKNKHQPTNIQSTNCKMKLATIASAAFLLAIQNMVNLSTCCPLPGDNCPTLPEETISYENYLAEIPVSRYSLNLTATKTDLAFNPNTISDKMANAQVTDDIAPGCSGYNFNASVHGGTDGQLNLACPFTYICDYNPQRVPPYIFHARCSSATAGEDTMCREMFYPIVTMTTESCNPLGSDEDWVMETLLVAVSCVSI